MSKRTRINVPVGNMASTDPWLPDDVFELYKERTQSYIDAGFPDCDPLMIPVIKYIQSLSGVTTVYCCEGHEETGRTGFYVMCVANQTGYPLLHKLLADLNVRNWSFLLAIQFTLIAGFNASTAPTDKPMLIPSHTFRARKLNEKRKASLFKALLNHIPKEFH